MDDLSMEVALINSIVINDSDLADSHTGDVVSCRGSDSTCANDEYSRILQLLLTRILNLREQHLARISFDRVFVQMHIIQVSCERWRWPLQ